MAEALGSLTPPLSPQQVVPLDEDAEVLPEDVDVLNWNIKFNNKPEGVPKSTQATKGIVAATLVLKRPALVLLQEVGWAPETGRASCQGGTKKTWIQRHLIGKNKVGDKCDRLSSFSDKWRKDGEVVLEDYKSCMAQASFEYQDTREQGKKESFKATGNLRDVYIMYRTSLLEEVPDGRGDKSLMQSFSELLLEELRSIKDQVLRTRADKKRGLTSALQSTFKKILGRAVCIALRSKSPNEGNPVKFLAMTVHMPYKVKDLEKVGQATLRAAWRLAEEKSLDLIIGGDWNVAVSQVRDDSIPNLHLLNSSADGINEGIDGVFMFSDSPFTPSTYSPYAWESDDVGEAEAMRKLSTFAKRCYQSGKNHMPILVQKPRIETLPGSEEQTPEDIQ